MEDKTISASEDQAAGAFVDALNRIRAAELLKKHNAALSRKASADRVWQKLRPDVEQLKKAIGAKKRYARLYR